jgi:L-2-hydroxyglutarate oxidase LhgO
VYPIPEPAGWAYISHSISPGRARFGPDVQWVEEYEYSVEPRRAERFYAAIRTYWPDLAGRRVAAGVCRDSAQNHRPDEALADFGWLARTPTAFPGIVNLFGIESPGLTASSLAELADPAAPRTDP